MVAALLAAAIAAFANFAYLSSVQDRAYENAERLKVFVVGKDIPKGLPGENALQEEYVKADEIPREFRPATAITDPTTIRAKVAITNLSVGQVVVEGMFVDPKIAQVSFSQRIPSGMVAITVSIDQVRGVAGLLVPGDMVNIMIDDGGDKRFLFQNVPIIAIGSSAAPQAGETAPAVNPGSGLITFAVPPLSAAKLALASTKDMYFTLVPPDNQPVDVPPVNDGNLFAPGQLTATPQS